MRQHIKSHIRTDHNSLSDAFEHVVEYLKANPLDFDAIAISGFSGAFIGVPLALKLEKDIILVRKQLDGYSGLMNEGPIEPCKVLIVDDIIASGETLKRIVQGVKNLSKRHKIVGALIYGRDEPFIEAKYLKSAFGIVL